jgi:hypothetical protein
LIGRRGRSHGYGAVMGHGPTHGDGGGPQACVGRLDSALTVAKDAGSWCERGEAKLFVAVRIRRGKPIHQASCRRGEGARAVEDPEPLVRGHAAWALGRL